MMKYLVFLTACISFVAHADYSESEFKSDLSSAYTNKTSQDIWLYGGSTTLALVLFRDQLVEPLQDDIAEKEPLGRASPIGDYAGQLVPNVIYMSYQLWFLNTPESQRRGKYMLKASAFAGMTTFFLKRLINEKRPHGGDRNSMPSGHTTTAFAFASVIGIEHPEWKWYGYGLATFIGLSRMNDNEHYLHNVTMGATIGMAYGYGLQNSKSFMSNTMVLALNDGGMVAYNYKF